MTCINPYQCKKIRDRLGGILKRSARAWWDEHGQAVAELGAARLVGLAHSLRKGDRVTAALLTTHIDTRTLEWWRDDRSATTEMLRGVAERRVAMRDALLSLGWYAARALGRAILAVL